MNDEGAIGAWGTRVVKDGGGLFGQNIRAGFSER